MENPQKIETKSPTQSVPGSRIFENKLLTRNDIKNRYGYGGDNYDCHLLIKEDDVNRIEKELSKLGVKALYFSKSKQKYVETDVYPYGVQYWVTNLVRNNIPVFYKQDKICEISDSFYENVKNNNTTDD